MDSKRSIRGSATGQAKRGPERLSVATIPTIHEHDAWLVAQAAWALVRCDAGKARFRDEASVFADQEEFAAALRSPPSRRPERAHEMNR